jgi:hypothetical protein
MKCQTETPPASVAALVTVANVVVVVPAFRPGVLQRLKNMFGDIAEVIGLSMVKADFHPARGGS